MQVELINANDTDQLDDLESSQYQIGPWFILFYLVGFEYLNEQSQQHHPNVPEEVVKHFLAQSQNDDADAEQDHDEQGRVLHFSIFDDFADFVK